jgi:hypothetical protein
MEKGLSRCCKLLLHHILGRLYHRSFIAETLAAEALPALLSKAEKKANNHITQLDLIHQREDFLEAPLPHPRVEQPAYRLRRVGHLAAALRDHLRAAARVPTPPLVDPALHPQQHPAEGELSAPP